MFKFQKFYSIFFCFILLAFIVPIGNAAAQTCTDGDGDGYGLNGDATCPNLGVDCDDTDATTYPDAPLLCDARDNNCDGWIDFATDKDDDGDGVTLCYHWQTGLRDCDDNNPNRYPGNIEGPFGDPTCSDGIDNDCDNKADSSDLGCAPDCVDSDGDGYGEFGDPSCPNAGVDCDEDNAAINPGAADDNCDNVDDNCSGTPDDEYMPTVTNCGVGECATTGTLTCSAGVESDSCVEGSPAKEGALGHPTCTDTVDNDCDGTTDASDPGCQGTCLDDDGDGYGFYGDVTCPNGSAIDCDDDNININPGASDDVCDGVDANCSGTPDDEYTPTVTNCGIGECATTGLLVCTAGATVDNCSPLAPGVEGPFGDPTCTDTLDNDCDGLIDQVPGIEDPECNPLDVDNDGDGFCEVGPCQNPANLTGDCDDMDAVTYPGAPQLCDAIDNDCDGWQDFYTDKDVDGDGVPLCTHWQTGLKDCDDNNPDRFPGNIEGPFGDATCIDAIDNDCDNKTDGADTGCSINCSDSDGDGYGSPGNVTCPNGNALDCNDDDNQINPGAADDVCNGVDNNCSGTPDDEYVDTPTNCGVGACASTGTLSCSAGVESDSCTAGTPVIEGPLGDGTCSDTSDNDCDGTTDALDTGCQSLCLDDDGDGYGLYGHASCTNAGVDCNDSNININPGAADDVCDGVDANCSGTADDQYVPTVTNCGVGECANTGLLICTAGATADNCIPLVPGMEGPPGDITCNDNLDNDCDGIIDNPSDCKPLDQDNDGDGFCRVGPCQNPANLGGDCDDTDVYTYPGAPRVCDAVDNDCDGWQDFYTDKDVDGDGVPLCTHWQTGLKDCDDNNPDRYPGNVEGPFGDPTCLDGIDNDCNNKIDDQDLKCLDQCNDSDGDGYGIPGHPSCTFPEEDCNDSNNLIHPGAADTVCDGVDDNCSGTADDEYTPTPTNCGVGECATTGQLNCNAGVLEDDCTPGQPIREICPNGLDDDCDGVPDASDPACGSCSDNDLDGYGLFGDPSCANAGVDCDDDNAAINPGAPDAVCDGVDDNCSGTADDEYTPTVTNCGVGECATTGLMNCNAGVLEDDCTPLTAGVEDYLTPLVCTDTLDNDCDGLIDQVPGIEDPGCNPEDVDNDGDGYCEVGPCLNPANLDGDCDDADPIVHPGGNTTICDAKDTNCDGWLDFFTDKDIDGDGVPLCEHWQTGLKDCDDNDPTRYPGNQEGPRDDPTCFDGFDNDCDNKTDNLDTDCAPPTCGTDPSPRDGPHMFDLLDGGNNVLKTACQWCHFDDSGTVDERTKCERCHADPAWGGPDDGTLKAVYTDPPPYGFSTATNVRVHSSTVLGTTYGAWDMECITCHNPHRQEQDNVYGTSYGKLIKEYICFNNTAIGGGNFEEIVEFTAATGPGSFADGPAPAPEVVEKNICQMCHTQTNHHRNDGLAPGDWNGVPGSGTYVGHNDGVTACTDCHPHGDGFAPSGGVADAPHNNTANPGVFPNCAVCHVTETDFTTPVPSANCLNCHDETAPNKAGGGSDIKVRSHFIGTMECIECHNPMFEQTNFRGNPNLSHIRTVVNGNQIAFEGKTGPFSFADDTNAAANGMLTENYICNTCHIDQTTNHHQADGTAPGGQSHNDGLDCTGCHTHQGGTVVPDAFRDHIENSQADAPHNSATYPALFTDCLECHVAAGDFVTPVPSAKCLVCHGSGGVATEADTHALSGAECIDCHNPMREQGSNAFHIRTTLATFTGADYVHGAPDFDGICETCHTITNHHQNDGTATLGQSHNDGVVCTTCHTHTGPSAAAGDGFWPPVVRKADAPHDTPLFDDCLVCHVDNQAPTLPLPNSKCNGCHATGTPDAAGGGANTKVETHHTPADLLCVDCHNPMDQQGSNLSHIRTLIATFTNNTTGAGFADGSGNGICETCHANTVFYNDAGTGAPHETGVCTTCHDHQSGMVKPNDPAHAPHNSTATPTFPTNCDVCHDPGTYVIGANILNSKCLGCHDAAAAGTAAGGSDTKVETHHTPGDLNCVECHNPMRAQGTNLSHIRTTLATFTANAAGSDFADGSGNGICETCHANTVFYNDAGTGAPHETGVCTTCHDHQSGMVKPDDPAHAPHNSTATPTFPTNCDVCHDPGTYVIGANILNSKCLGCHDAAAAGTAAGGSDTKVETHHTPGDLNCVECHNPMRAQGTNLSHIRTTLATFTANAAGSDFADGSGNGICETCHTATTYYNNTGTGASHFTDACTGCHTHEAGFQPVGGIPPFPHDTQDCTTCHTGASFSDPITDAACLSCHDEAAPGSGSLNQVDNFTGLTTGDAGRPIFGNWTGLPGDDTTNGWMAWTGSTASIGTGPSDDADGGGTYVVLESSSSSGGVTVDTMGFGTAGNAASNSSTSNRYVDRTNPATADATITSISANMNSTGNVTFYTISSISPSCNTSCSGTVTDIVTVNASSTGVNTWNGLSLAVNNGDHLGFVSTSATVRRSSSGTFVRYIYSQGNSVSISENITDFQYSSTNNHGLQIEATYEYGTCTGDCDPANGADVTAGSEQYLESNVLDASMYAFNFTFDWNMNVGDNADASLHLDAWNGTSWDLDVTGAPINTGNNNDVWVTEGPIDLSTYANADFKFRIRYLVGNGTIELNDVAVDNLIVTGTGTGGGSDLKVMTHGDTLNPPRPYTYSNACVDCHNPMYVQPNLAFIRPTVTKSVLGGTIDFTEYTGAGSFADGSPYTDNICDTCHSLTQHHQADGSAPGGQSHNDATDCALCHPHLEGFQPQGGCTVCHSQSPPIGSSDTDRRQIVEGTPGDGQGDFVKISHHVSDGTTTEIVTDDDCVVCHDQSSHQSFGDGQTVLLNDQDGGASSTYDGTGASIEGFCASCHDADGSTVFGPQPFSASGDTNSPVDIGWSAGAVSHSTFDTCFNCHEQGHGSDFEKILVEDNEPGLCFNCHDADGPASTDISSKFAQQFGHPVTAANSSIHCLDCHNPHQAESGTHTPDGQWYPSSPDANTNLVSGVLSGVMGVEPSPWAPAWTKTDSYTVLDSAEKEYQICFKCHARYSHQYSQDCFLCHPMTWDPDLGAIIAGFKFRSAQREFNINNKSAHPVAVTANNQSGSYAPKALSTSQMEAPWTNVGNQTMYCADCHGAENELGADPRGPHGSDKPFMLKGPNTMWPAGSVRLFSLNDVSGDSSTESLNTNWRNEIFCLNCHDSFPSSNRNTWQNEVHREHDDRDYDPLGSGGSNKNVYCIACHAAVPHGSHVSRLITYRTELPEYNTYNDDNYNVIEGFRKTSRFNYTEDDCRTVTNLGCDKHDDRVNTWD